MSLGPQIEPRGPRHVLWQGQEYLFFGGNDYHRLAFHPEVLEAACEAARKWGLNPSGSRTTNANHPVYEALEHALAQFLGAEAAAVVSAGYLSNLALLQALGGRFTHALVDEQAHSSLVDAAKAAGLALAAYKHRNVESLAEALSGLPAAAKPVVLTDGVFASTGRIAPLKEIQALGVPVVVDDAHGMGTLGPGGTGSWSECGAARANLFQTGTLSKGLGGFGGVVAADRDTIEDIKARSLAFAGSTPMPIPMAAAALKSLEILTREPERVALLQCRSLGVKRELRAMGFSIEEQAAPICSVTFLDETKNQRLYERLKNERIYPSFVNYPGSPPGGHFRFTLSSAHEEADIERLLSAVRDSALGFIR